jgi:RNA polymerase sigma-70 factor (ECF subfamily)
MSSILKDEFLDIVSQYQGILHKVCLIYFQDKDDRKDNFQEILYQLWKSYPSLKKHESLGSWIYKIAINTSIAKIRKESRYVNTESFPEVLDSYDLFEEFAQNENIKLLISGIHSLNDIDKSVIFLYLEEKSYQEISDIIGISVSNVGTKINRIKSQLKKTLNFISHEK